MSETARTKLRKIDVKHNVGKPELIEVIEGALKLGYEVGVTNNLRQASESCGVYIPSRTIYTVEIYEEQ